VRFLRASSFASRRWALLVAVLLAANASAGVESAFGAWTKVAAWQMNEGVNATVMHDSSGNGRTGTIGSTVETGVVVSGTNKAYQWPADVDVVDNNRLVKVNSRALNPRRDAFAVTIRLKTGVGENNNIIQKGQATTAGGMWKIDILNGRIFCTFKGAAGRAAIGSRETVSDDAWHTVQCVRRRTGVTITVDGGVPRKQAGRTGRIANDWPLAIGGKLVCNAGTVQCHYYVGLLDRAIVRRGT
jgi:hypothetical protein